MVRKARKPGEVVEEFDVKGKDGRKHRVVFRVPKMGDAKANMNYLNTLVDEAEFLRVNKKVTLVEEKKWLRGRLDGIAKGDILDLMVMFDGRIAGKGGIKREPGNSSHACELDIAMLEKYTGMGIGGRMIAALEKEARRLGFELVMLACQGCNSRAHHLYEKMGFADAGRIPRFVKHGDRYDDEVIMYKDIGTKGG